MPIDMTNVKQIMHGEKEVVKIEDSNGNVLWQKQQSYTVDTTFSCCRGANLGTIPISSVSNTALTLNISNISTILSEIKTYYGADSIELLSIDGSAYIQNSDSSLRYYKLVYGSTDITTPVSISNASIVGKTFSVIKENDEYISSVNGKFGTSRSNVNTSFSANYVHFAYYPSGNGSLNTKLMGLLFNVRLTYNSKPNSKYLTSSNLMVSPDGYRYASVSERGNYTNYEFVGNKLSFSVADSSSYTYHIRINGTEVATFSSTSRDVSKYDLDISSYNYTNYSVSVSYSNINITAS